MCNIRGYKPESKKMKPSNIRKRNCRSHAIRTVSCPRVKRFLESDTSTIGHDCDRKFYGGLADNFYEQLNVVDTERNPQHCTPLQVQNEQSRSS